MGFSGGNISSQAAAHMVPALCLRWASLVAEDVGLADNATLVPEDLFAQADQLQHWGAYLDRQAKLYVDADEAVDAVVFADRLGQPRRLRGRETIGIRHEAVEPADLRVDEGLRALLRERPDAPQDGAERIAPLEIREPVRNHVDDSAQLMRASCEQ